MRIFRSLFTFLVIGLLVAACSSKPLPSDASAGQQRDLSEYTLGPGDKLRLTVFGEEQLTGEYSISSSGQVAVPLIGNIKAAGLTVPALQQAVEAALREGYLKEPRVSAEVLNYRPYYILGEVNKPGEYPYTANLTVLNAVARAEGFTYRANTKRIFIKRADQPEEKVYVLTTTTPVAPGDTIRVGERFF